MRLLHWAAVVVCVLNVSGCRPGGRQFVSDVPAGPKPWTHLTFNDSAAGFQFAIVADRTGGHVPGQFVEAVEKLNLLQPEFVICVGDLVEGYTEERAELLAQWDEFDKIVARLEMPFFQVAGNHDISNAMAEQVYYARYGRPYYHFLYKDVLFLVVCTEDPPASNISDAQAEYMVRALKENRDAPWTMVFLHKPMFVENPEGKMNPGWTKIEEALTGRPHTVIGGHVHNYSKRTKHGQSYILLAVTGAGKRRPQPELGSLAHVVWATMTHGGPRLTNLMLEGIHDENVTTPESAAFYRGLLAATKMEIGPLWAEADQPTSIETSLLLANMTEYPVMTNCVFGPSKLIIPEPKAFDVLLPPGSEKTVKLAFRSVQPMPVEELPPLELKRTRTFHLPDEKSYTMTDTMALRAVKRYDIPQRKAPVVVDGKLDEWPALSNVEASQGAFDVAKAGHLRWNAETWTGSEDCSFRFAVAYDDEFLYVAVRATDDQLKLSPTKKVWVQDGMCVNFYARRDPGRPSRPPRDGVMSVLVSPGEQADGMVASEPESWPEGTKVMCIKTARGHDTEMAIPVAWLDAQQGGRLETAACEEVA